MASYKITYKYHEKNNAAFKKWDTNFTFVNAIDTDDAEKQFFNEWTNDRAAVEIIDCIATGSRGGARAGAGRPSGPTQKELKKVYSLRAYPSDVDKLDIKLQKLLDKAIKGRLESK